MCTPRNRHTLKDTLREREVKREKTHILSDRVDCENDWERDVYRKVHSEKEIHTEEETQRHEGWY